MDALVILAPTLLDDIVVYKDLALCTDYAVLLGTLDHPTGYRRVARARNEEKSPSTSFPPLSTNPSLKNDPKSENFKISKFENSKISKSRFLKFSTF